MRMRTVVVEQLPGITSEKEKRVFLREIQSCLVVNRPRLVLDCSAIGQLNQHLIEMLLTCLEEALKRNGDIKLAAVSPEAKAQMKQIGIGDLFEISDTVVDAVHSFRRFAATPVSQPTLAGFLDQESESAA